jgi:hypothetical protein
MKKHPLTTLRCPALAVALLASALFPPAAFAAAPDLDGDGIPNVVDPDIDSDGIPNALDRNVDGGIAKSGTHKDQYIGDHLDNDSPAENDIDGDDLADDSLGERDTDGDGRRNDDATELDIDGDDRKDDAPGEMDIDGDGANDDASVEDDVDGDGFSDDDSSEMDIDGDSRSDDDDTDIDGDSRANSDAAEVDTDGDGKSDGTVAETNDDGDRMENRQDGDDDNDGNADEDDSDHRREDDEMQVQTEIPRAGAPAGSRLRAMIERTATGKIKFRLEGRDFPAGAYAVIVDGTNIGSLTMVASGGESEGGQEWETNHNKPEELPLNIDIIGKPIILTAGGTTFFSGTVPTPPAPGDPGTPPTPVPGILTKGPAAPAGASGHVEISFSAQGPNELEVEIEDVPAGSYQVLIGGTARGTLTAAAVNGTVKGKLKYDVNPELAGGELALDFAAAGEALIIRQGESVFFTGNVPAAPPGVGDGGNEGGDGNVLVAALTNTSSAPLGSEATVEIQFGAAGATGLEIEVEGAPLAAYDVFIDGNPRGFVEVTALGVRGRLRFEISPEHADELPLDFLAPGKTITISQGATVLFQGLIPQQPEA